jgi:tetratricopeptide (TPR) repeat protein
MSEDKLSQIFNKPVKNIINIGRLTLNTRIAWVIGISLLFGSGALIYSAVQPRTTINNPQTTNNNPIYIINNPPPTALGEKLSDAEKAKAQVVAEQSRKVTEANPNDATAWTNLGEALRRTGDLPGAQQAQEKALQLNPKLTEAKLGLALIKKDQGKTAEVIPELRTIAEEEKSASAYFNLGRSLREQKDLKGAEAAYRQSIVLNPNGASGHNNLGNVLYEQEKFDSAIESFQTAIHLNPNSAEVYVNLGLALNASGKLERAIESFQAAIHINPNLAESYAGLGVTLNRQGRNPEAKVQFRQALSLFQKQGKGDTPKAKKLIEIYNLVD